MIIFQVRLQRVQPAVTTTIIEVPTNPKVDFQEGKDCLQISLKEWENHFQMVPPITNNNVSVINIEAQ